MATKSTKKKKPTSKKKSVSGNKQNEKQNHIYMEIVMLVVLGISILLMISNFGFGGYVGNLVSGVLFGIFGLIAYLIPILLFFGVIFTFSNRENTIAYIKVGAGVIGTFCICALLQLVIKGFHRNTKIYDYYQYARDHKTAGGLIGGLITKLLCPAFGVIGAYVILIILLLAALILISEKSMLRQLMNQKDTYMEKRQAAAERNAAKKLEKREAAARRAREEERMPEAEDSRSSRTGSARGNGRRNRRVDHTVSGVSMDTTLRQSKSPELRELSAPDISDDRTANSDSLRIQRADSGSSSDGAADRAAEETASASADPMKIKRQRKTKESRAQAAQEEARVVDEIALKESEQTSKCQLPPLTLLKKGAASGGGDSDVYLKEMAAKLQNTLENFGVRVKVTDVSCGPSVTRYELQPEQGVKVSRIVGLSDDIKLNLAAPDIRIEAPIPGKAAVGIEVPNKKKTPVLLRDLLEDSAFKNSKSKLTFAVGRDIAGKTIVADIQKMPHLLIAGATGSGKSIFINTLVMSILYKATPDEVKLIMIDPKVVEFKIYNGIPHLMIPVVTDPKKAAGALNWAVTEMTRRYQLFAEYNARDLKGYNAKVDRVADIEDENKPKRLPQIVIVVDELADLMMVAPGEVEEAICRLAQLARAAGIHLVIATQRPSVNVITGLIKANMPSRIALSVSSGVDSRTIIDMNGAEKLLGNGDMLFYPSGYQKPVRIQGGFVSDDEVQRVVEFLTDNKSEDSESYSKEIEEQVNSCIGASLKSGMDADSGSDKDEYFEKAARIIVEKDKASIGMLQRSLKIGFNRAARIMDQLCEAGIVGEEEGTKPRRILMSPEQLEQYIEEYL